MYTGEHKVPVLYLDIDMWLLLAALFDLGYYFALGI